MACKVLLLVAMLAVATFALKDTDMILDDSQISAINNGKSSWVASRNKRFEGWTVGDVKGLLGYRTKSGLTIGNVVDTVDESLAIPDAFDARQQWPSCIHPILDQGQCGSCCPAQAVCTKLTPIRAFGATEVLSDRFCIESNGTINVVLSPQSLVSCAFFPNDGCSGGIPQVAWDYMEFFGVATLDCYPYSSGNSGDSGSCEKQCNDGTNMVKYKSKKFSDSTYRNVQSIQQEIMTNGPVEGAFSVYSDFMSYSSGVYVKSADASELGGHAIKIVGWGHDNNSTLDYWIVANSWGVDWGMSGFFWIERGTDMCGIEHDVCAGHADLSSGKN